MKLVEIIVKGLFGTFDNHIILKNNITILLGENGFGKTVTLKMLEAFFEREFVFYCSIWFEEFTLIFETQTFCIKKLDNNIYLNNQKIIDYKNYEEAILTTIRFSSRKNDEVIKKYENLQTLLENNEIPNLRNFTKNYNNVILQELGINRFLLPKHHSLFVSTQRLFLFDARFRRANSNWLNKEPQKNNFFLHLLNSYLLNKKVKIENGKLICFSEITNTAIPLPSLSSGEQHLFVLFYKLIFELKDTSFVLFDEPEISLHISWQNRFISDLKQIIENQDVNILIATHSPNLIGTHWDLTVELAEPNIAHLQ